MLGDDAAAFDIVCRIFLRVDDPRLRKRLWRALCRDESTCTVRFQLSRFWHDAGSNAELMRLINHSLTPSKTCRWLERSVAAGHLSRAEGSHVQENVLQYTSSDGNWKSE